jgi:hypothetical protein
MVKYPGLMPTYTRLSSLLGLALVAVATPGLAVELADHLAPKADIDPWVVMLSLSYEANIPTWYSSCLLFCCGIALGVVSLRVWEERAPFRWHWSGLAVIFGYMSMDEAVGFHEHLNSIADLPGIFYFAWVIPVGIAVAVLGLVYLKFLRHLPPATRRGFVIAGAIYVTGALGMELPLGYWADQNGEDNLGYALIDFVEEVLEIHGASRFLIALWDYIRGSGAGGEHGK